VRRPPVAGSRRGRGSARYLTRFELAEWYAALRKAGPGRVNTISNNTSRQTEGDLERAAAAKRGAGAGNTMSQKALYYIRKLKAHAAA
jgi:hypothetical protein